MSQNAGDTNLSAQEQQKTDDDSVACAANTDPLFALEHPEDPDTHTAPTHTLPKQHPSGSHNSWSHSQNNLTSC